MSWFPFHTTVISKDTYIFQLYVISLLRYSFRFLILINNTSNFRGFKTLLKKVLLCIVSLVSEQ